MPVKCYFHLFSDNFLSRKIFKKQPLFLSGLQMYREIGEPQRHFLQKERKLTENKAFYLIFKNNI